jgi:hypothetical protein
VPLQCHAQKAFGSREVSPLTEPELDRIAVAIDGAIQRADKLRRFGLFDRFGETRFFPLSTRSCRATAEQPEGAWPCLVCHVDESAGENAGFVLAEIELRHPGQSAVMPGWIGDEETSDDRCRNSRLADAPWGKGRGGDRAMSLSSSARRASVQRSWKAL